jgi:hypothetical protein
MNATSRFHTLSVVCGVSPSTAVFTCDPANSSGQLLSMYVHFHSSSRSFH